MNLQEAKRAGDRIVEQMTKGLREYEDKTGRRSPEREEMIDELTHAFGAFVGASYLLNHTKTLVGLLQARTDLTPEEQQEIDYLKQHMNL